MADRQELSIKNGLCKNGKPYVYLTIEQAMDIIGCSKPTAVNLFRELERTQLIYRQKRKNAASMIFVQKVKKLDVQEIYCENAIQVKEFDSEGKNFEPKAVKKLDSIKTEFNQTENNQTEISMCSLVTRKVCDIFNQHKKAAYSKGRNRPGKYANAVVECILNAGYTSAEIYEAAQSLDNWYELSDYFNRVAKRQTQ